MVKCESLRLNMYRITHTGKSMNFPITLLCHISISMEVKFRSGMSDANCNLASPDIKVKHRTASKFISHHTIEFKTKYVKECSNVNVGSSVITSLITSPVFLQTYWT